MESNNKSHNQKNLKKSDKNSADKEKKSFNKSKYRQQKYSNKFKVKQWEEKRKKAVLRSFYKDLKKEEKEAKFNFSKKGKESNQSEDTSDSAVKKAKIPFFSAKQEYLKKKKEKEKRKEEIQKSKQEREEAIKKYREKKMQAFKQLSKKTKKGQPVMSGRMELLLEKIQQSV